MPNHELPSSTHVAVEPAPENLDASHFYVAYVFDRAETRKQDITTLIREARWLDYPVRYWWLSAAVDLQGSPDRLIVCVHHPSTDVNAAMDLGDALYENSVTWDDLEAAAVKEYRDFGQPVETSGSILKPGGTALFPLPGIDQASQKQREIGPETTEYEQEDTTSDVRSLVPRPVITLEKESDTEFLVYYSLSGLALVRATGEGEASDRVFASVHSLVGKMGTRGLTAMEANQVGLSDAVVEIDSIEPFEPSEDESGTPE